MEPVKLRTIFMLNPLLWLPAGFPAAKSSRLLRCLYSCYYCMQVTFRPAYLNLQPYELENRKKYEHLVEPNQNQCKVRAPNCRP